MNRGYRDEFEEEEEEFRRLLDAVPPPTPPDGGWGWVIVFSSFCMNMIVDGVCYSYGILMSDVVQAYKSNTLIIGLGGALLLGTNMMSGPVACALCNRFGSRRIALLGSFITFIAFLASLATNHGSVFVVLFGVCGGAGFGMMFLSAVLLVGFYFEKNRSIAATIAMCGSSIGMSVMAPLTHLLLIEYGWSGAITLLVGFVIQGFVLGALLKPIDADLQLRKKMILKRMEEDKKIGPQTCIIMQKLIEEKRRQKTISSGSLNNAIITKDNVFIKAKDLHKYSMFRSKLGGSSSICGTPKLSRANSPMVSRKHPQPQPVILINDSPSPSVESSPVPMRSRSRSSSPTMDLRKQVLLSGLKRNGSAKSLDMNQGCQPQIVDDSGAKDFSSVQDMASNGPTPTAQQESMVRQFLSNIPDVDRPMYRKDILYTGSVPHLAEYNKHNMDEYIASITQIPPENKNSTDCWARLHFLPKSMVDVLRTLFSTDTCRSPTFMLLAFSSSLTMLGYYVPFLLLPIYAKTYIAKDDDYLYAALLLSILGVSNTIGRIISGYIGTKSWVDSLVINNIALLVAGGVTMALPFCDTFPLQSLFAVVFGICVAAFSSLRSILVVELIGLDKLTTCFNQLVIFHGIAVMVGTPLACYTYDMRKSCDFAFYFAGGVIFISGLLSLPLRKLSDCEKRRNGIVPSNNSSEDDMKKSNVITKPRAIEMVAI